MPLPTGLLPVFVFVLTVGISVPVAVGAFVFAGWTREPFEEALQAALVVAAGLYLVGTLAVWAIAGWPGMWGVAMTLLLTGVIAFGGLMVIPLLLGQLLVQRVRPVDDQRALRVTTIGWPFAMLGVFLIFFAPGGLAGGDFFSLSGPSTCAAGFCGISVPFAIAVGLAAAVAIFGPGIIGVGFDISTRKTAGRQLHS